MTFISPLNSIGWDAPKLKYPMFGVYLGFVCFICVAIWLHLQWYESIMNFSLLCVSFFVSLSFLPSLPPPSCMGMHVFIQCMYHVMYVEVRGQHSNSYFCTLIMWVLRNELLSSGTLICWYFCLTGPLRFFYNVTELIYEYVSSHSSQLYNIIWTWWEPKLVILEKLFYTLAK